MFTSECSRRHLREEGLRRTLKFYCTERLTRFFHHLIILHRLGDPSDDEGDDENDANNDKYNDNGDDDVNADNDQYNDDNDDDVVVVHF